MTIKNVAAGSSGPTIVLVSGVGTYSIPSIGPGQSVAFNWPCKAGTLTATVDPSNRVTESNESNNVTVRRTTCLGFGA